MDGRWQRTMLAAGWIPIWLAGLCSLGNAEPEATRNREGEKEEASKQGRALGRRTERREGKSEEFEGTSEGTRECERGGRDEREKVQEIEAVDREMEEGARKGSRKRWYVVLC